MATYFKEKDDGIMFCRGNVGPPCAERSWIPVILCDYPVGEGKTCDRLLCEDHAHRVSDHLHYCDTHWKMWNDFVDSGEAHKIMMAKIHDFKP